MSETLSELIARLRALERKATPGPWDNEYHYTMASVFRKPNDVGVPVGQCYACRSPEHEMVKERKTYHVHRTRHGASFGYEFWHQIHNAEGVTVAGNYDYEDGGIISAEDAALIIAMRNALPAIFDALDPPIKKRRPRPEQRAEDDG